MCYKWKNITKNIKTIGAFTFLFGSYYSYNIYEKQYWMNNIDKNEYDIGIIGGGIIGLATIRELKLRYPNKKMVLFEKENELGSAQTGHNSGVIHAGMYYKPESMKALLCVEGAKLIYDYCSNKKIPYKKIGKLIVASNEDEFDRLKEIYQRALINKVTDIYFLESQEEIIKVEPYCKGLKAIHCKSTGIVDWQIVAKSFGKDFVEKNGVIYLNHKVNNIIKRENDILVCSEKQKSVKVKNLITCAGVYSDRISKMSGSSYLPKIIPFRGEYLLLKKDKSYLVNGNIYPVPNSRFPFLGVHFTPRINGDIWLGPNAVMGFSREGYSYFNINILDLLEQITYSGFLHIARKHAFFGLNEIYKSIIISAQIKELQKYIPEITIQDVVRGPSGVRAQAVEYDGTLVEDFVFDESQDGILHVRNAPSPGATSSLAIARMIADKAEKNFKNCHNPTLN